MNSQPMCNSFAMNSQPMCDAFAMNSQPMRNSFAGGLRFSNYDILLAPTAPDEPVRLAAGNHVGNRRFRVFLDLNRQRYIQAEMFGHEYECVSIAEEVLETVCDRCVPSGRFFEQGRDNGWRMLDRHSHSTIILIRNALKNEPVDDASPMEPSPKRACPASCGFDLLQRAASKALPAPVGFVASPNPFDVVCEADGLGLSRDRLHKGNNRLRVMLDLRRKSYGSAPDRASKRRIAEEVVSSIVDASSARFLLQPDETSDTYRIVSRDVAAECVGNAFEAGAGWEKRKFRKAEVGRLERHRHKKSVLDRLEHRRGTLDSLDMAAVPTAFRSFKRKNELASKAA